jgi:preprotein translocase subunit YajC
MPGLLSDLFFPIFAAKPTPAAGDPFAQMMMMFLPVIFLFYLLIWRPQQQQEKKRRQMIEAMKKNDKVLTSSGIYGTVVSVDSTADKVVLRVDDDRGVKMVFSKTSVARVLDAAAEKDKDKDKATENASS